MPQPRRRRFSASDAGRFQIKNAPRRDASTAETAETPLLPADLDDTDEGESIVESSPEAEDANSSLPAAFQLTHTRRARMGLRNRTSYGLAAFLSVLCLALGGLGGYFWPKSAPAPENDDATHKKLLPLTAAEQEDLDNAYAARHDSKFAEARQLFTKISRVRKDWGWLDVEVGRTLLYENSLRDMANVLTSALEKGDSPAEANFLLAARQNSLRNFADAEAYFAKAVALDPTQPNYYYCWGECLRGQGKLLEAIDKLRSALLRNQYETATGLYRLKFWLCEIEAGQAESSGLNKQLDLETAQTYPSMESLFASAARSLKAGNEEVAVKQILRARLCTDQTVFFVIINDPIFTPVRSRPEIAALLRAKATPPDVTTLPAVTASPSVATQ